MQAFWHLENIDLTDIFCPHKMAKLDKIVHHQELSLNKGDTIYIPTELSRHIFLIVQGSVKIATTNPQGKEIIKAILHKGEVFGELALFSEGTRDDVALALEPTMLCVLEKNELRLVMRDRGDLWQFFMGIFASRRISMEKRLETLVFKDSRSRIVELLVNLTEQKGQRVGYEWVLRNFYTHQQLAGMTATSRQTVTTTLNDLRADKLIKFDRNRLLVRDLEGLRALLH